jgi:hypothetical protein
MMEIFDVRARSRARTTIVLAFLCTLVIVVLYPQQVQVDKWRDCSSAFIEQVNALGRDLEPGGNGVIHVSAEDADELILLPAHSTREELNRSLPGRRPILIDTLYNVSCDDSTSPALVWLRGRRVLSINPAKFSVGLNSAPRSWTFRRSRDIQVAKEARSPNSFLSLTLQ